MLSNPDLLRLAVDGDGQGLAPAISEGEVLTRLGLSKHHRSRARLKALAEAHGIAIPVRAKDGPGVGASILADREAVMAAHAQAHTMKDLCVALNLAVTAKTYVRVRIALRHFDLPSLDPTNRDELRAARIRLDALPDSTLVPVFRAADSIAAALETLGQPPTRTGYRWVVTQCDRLEVPLPYGYRR